MKYSFMSFSCPDLDFDESLKLAKKYGYTGFEPRTSSGHRHGIEVGAPGPFLREVKDKTKEFGISICCLATGCHFSDPARNAENLELARRSIELASEVGAPVVRVFGGRIPEGMARDRSEQAIIESLANLAEEARSQGVTVCIETHDDWCDPRNVARILKAVNRPSIAANWDIMHPVLTGGTSMTSAFEVLKPWIRHVHVHDGHMIDNKLVFLPIGSGRVDHATALVLLEDCGYGGFVSGEWIDWESYDTHLPREIAAMRAALADHSGREN
jgi:sugar phosphate isomerase/epimerase